MSRPIGFLAGLEYVKYRPDEVVSALCKQSYQAISWPLCWFDPKRKSDDDRKKLVKSTINGGMIVSEWVVQIDYISQDTGVHRSRIQNTLSILQALVELSSKSGQY